MNAPIKTDPRAEEIEREVEELLGRLECAHARRKIVDAWLNGRLDGDCAMQALIGCELIEHSGMPDE